MLSPEFQGLVLGVAATTTGVIDVLQARVTGGGVMLDVFHDAQRTHAFGNALMVTGLLLLLMGVLGGYIVDARLALPLQVLAHLQLIVGPTLIKVGYVMQINARQRLHMSY
jgi:hypothetical protein